MECQADESTSESEDSSSAKRLRVLLINPTIIGKFEHLHIGLATIGSYIRKHSSHEVRNLDFLAYRRSWRQHLRALLVEYRPNLVGIYISTPYFPSARKVAEEIKRVDPTIQILAGGHHASLSPEDVFAHEVFDLLIIGEGERPVLQLVNTLAEGAPLERVAGLWWREDGEVRRTPKARLIPPGNIPTIDWSLHDEETLRKAFLIWGILPVMASRGCPANCSFCSITNYQKLYEGEEFLRFRDPGEVIDEIETAYHRYRNWGLRIVFFYDLNFLINPEWVRDFTAEYRRRGLNRELKWSAYTRADHVTPNILDYLKDSGCVNLRVGIEAANPFMRNEVYRKEVSQHDLIEALVELKKLDIALTGYFIAGGPGERPEWLIESLELAKRYGIEFPVFFLYKPLAGTDILEMAAELGSHVLADRMEEASDYLQGVHLSNRNIKSWQLEAFLRLTHLTFGPALVSAQLRQEGPRYVTRFLSYMVRAIRLGFSPYLASSYFIFYGYDHLRHPIHLPIAHEPGLAWRALMGVTGLWLRSPPGAEPPLPGE